MNLFCMWKNVVDLNFMFDRISDFLLSFFGLTYVGLLGLFSLPMWINKSPIWTNPFLSISPFLWGKYKPILGLIFRFFRESFSAAKREKKREIRSQKSSHNNQLQIAIPASFFVWLSWFLDSILSSSQSLIRNWQSWIWWSAASVLLSWTVAAKLVILLL